MRNLETRLKISNSMRGRKLSSSHIENIRLANLGEKSHFFGRGFWSGKKRPNMTGEFHPRWNNGPLKRRIRQSTEAKLWRIAIFTRDEYICQNCGQEGGDLEAHHIKSFAKYPELRVAIDNGITLCKRCHAIIDKDRRLKN